MTVLGRIKDTRAVDGLLAALGDQSPTVRVKALTALRSNAARGEAAAVFVEALSSEDAAIRKEALWQLRLMASWEDRLDCGEDPAKWRAWLEKRRHAEKTKGRKASQR